MISCVREEHTPIIEKVGPVLPDLILERCTARSPGLMMWNVISNYNRMPLLITCRRLEAHRFIDNSLKICYTFMERHSGTTLRQDNVCLHTACISLERIPAF